MSKFESSKGNYLTITTSTIRSIRTIMDTCDSPSQLPAVINIINTFLDREEWERKKAIKSLFDINPFRWIRQRREMGDVVELIGKEIQSLVADFNALSGSFTPEEKAVVVRGFKTYDDEEEE